MNWGNPTVTDLDKVVVVGDDRPGVARAGATKDCTRPGGGEDGSDEGLHTVSLRVLAQHRLERQVVDGQDFGGVHDLLRVDGTSACGSGTWS